MLSPKKPVHGATNKLMTTNNISNLSNEVINNFDSKVVAPRNPKLLYTTEIPKLKMSPSMYMKEMSMNTEEKLAATHEMRLPRIVELLDMSETTHQKVSYVDIEVAMFQPFPSEIYFQNFEPFKTCEVPLLLRNNDKVPRLVKVVQNDSPYFKIISPDDVSHKVAPGMASVFKIRFTPEDKKDYTHELVCLTERECFVVPVRAVGSRAVLDFPDEVNFSTTCPVKHPSNKSLLVRNVGNRDAKCTFAVKPPFQVSCEQGGSLAVGDSMQVSVEFRPIHVGDYKEDLIVKYDTGDEVAVALYGGSVNANVRLDKNTLRIDNTFIFMANQRSVTIHNRSGVLAHYKWSPFATRRDENRQKHKFCSELTDEESQERERFFQECVQDPTLRDRLSILTRTFSNRRRIVNDDPLLFQDDVFKLFPLEGDIWPNSSVECTVVFKPTEARTYQQTIFCDVTGRETRLPLKIRGDGMGPKLVFSFDSLDIGNIFAGSSHIYEAVLINKGDIDAIFGLIAPGGDPLRFTEFTFNPNEGIVLPGGHQTVQVTFRSESLGSFRQEFKFGVDGSPDHLTLTVVGNVIGPTFHFDVPRLRFGEVSYGFNHSNLCTLVNTSLVPMSVVLRIPADGSGEPSISGLADLDDGLLAGMSNFTKLTSPREFDIVPAQGTIRPQSEMRVQVTLCSNTLKRYDYSLVVDVKGVGKEILSLPITAKAIVPEIQVMTPLVDMGRCFLNHSYQVVAKLSNDTDLPAKYELLTQVRNELTPMVYGSGRPKGLIEPRSVIEIPLVCQVHDLDEQEITAHFSIFGSPNSPLAVQLKTVGEGPVVFVTPEQLDWGSTEVLQPCSRTLLLSNESLIPADFLAQMMRPDTVWFVDPPQGTIPPETEMTVTLTAVLNDAVKFYDKLTVSVIKGPTVTVPVQAYGYGTTIVSDPPIAPSVSLGPHFANNKCVRRFVFTNRGRRHQGLTWSTDGFHRPRPTGHPSRTAVPSKDIKYKTKMQLPALPEPIFRLKPNRFALEPGESQTVILEGLSKTPRQVTESLTCHAIIGKANGKERIIRTSVRADFIAPVLQLDKRRIDFRVDKRPDDVTALTPQTRTFAARNVSSLPLTCVMRVQRPFQLLDFYGTPQSMLELNLTMGQQLDLTVRFDPAFKDDLVSRVAEGEVSITFVEHPHADSLKLKGEVNFPNLDFDKDAIDFGCVLNDTEVARYVDITNSSPLPVSYRWSFLVHEGENNIVFNGETPRGRDDQGEWNAAEADRASSGDQRHPPHDGDEQADVAPAPPPDVAASHHETTGAEEPTATDPRTGSVTPEEFKRAHRMSEVGTDRTEFTLREEEQQTTDDGAGVEMGGGGSGDEDDELVNIASSDHQGFDDGIPHAASMQVAGSGDDGTGLSVEWSRGRGDVEDEEVIQRRMEAEVERMRSVSRLSSRHQPSHPDNTRIEDFPLLPWLEPGSSHVPSGVEEVFDILPLYGTLEPGETQRVTFTYYGHADVSCNARAICEVQGGPKYEVKLEGEASLIEYEFDRAQVEFGKQMFDQVAVERMRLSNPGRVGFDFEGLGGLSETEDVVPGIPTMKPRRGHVPPFSDVTLEIHYLPGVPEKFHKTFEVQVAHFEPSVVNVRGEGVFHRLALDLPRYEAFRADDDGRHAALLKEARENVEGEKRPAGAAIHDAGADASDAGGHPTFDDQTAELPSDLEVQTEMERLILRDFASENQYLFTVTSATDAGEGTPTSKKKKFPRIRLSDYMLDFGYVVLGNIRSHIVRATNTSHFPISFRTDRSTLYQSGFNVELDRVKQLPGSPDHETVDFKVTFDPRGANLGMGPVETCVPINIVGGPQVCVHLRAHVAVPELKLSSEQVDFESVQCGQCKVVTIQLLNDEKVRCEWTSVPSTNKQNTADKHVPMHLRKKMRKEQRPKPNHFEMMPAQGILEPGQRMNVQLKFMPTEERAYSHRMQIHIAQATSRVFVAVRGEGLEPRVEFDPSMVELGPILPHGAGDDVEMVVRNPTPFAVELYSLNFDKQYLLEEKILRMMKGYDEHENLLLPPRIAGEELPPELLQFYQEYEEKLEAAKTTAETEGDETIVTNDETDTEGDVTHDNDVTLAQHADGQHVVESPSSSKKRADGSEANMTVKKSDAEQEGEVGDVMGGVGELEITPVASAIARHLGIDLTPEGRAARNRRGIVIIVHGPPQSGKTNASVLLAKTYGAARLSLDDVILEAISSGNSKVGLRAREHCANAARGFREDESENAAGGAGGLSVEAVAAHAATNISAADPKIGGASVISTKKASVTSKQAHSTIGGGGGKGGVGTVSDNTGSQVQSHTPPALGAPIARRLSVSASVAGEEGLMSCVLPEDVLVEIVAERMQLNDCQQGVVFDGLDTLFSAGYQATAQALLKAINNRKFIHFVSLKLDYGNLRDRLKKREEETAKSAKEEEEYKKSVIDEMDEEEYDALPDHVKQKIDLDRLNAKRQRLRKEAEERQERERVERERLALLEERRLEDEIARKKGKKVKRDETAKRSISGKHPDNQAGSGIPPGGGKDKIKGAPSQTGAAVQQFTSSLEMLDKRPDSRLTERPDSNTADDQGKRGGKKGRRPVSDEDRDARAPPVEEEPSEEEKQLMQKFRVFEHAQKDISFLLEFWDRTQLIVNRPLTPDGTDGDGKTDPDADATGAGGGAAAATRDKPPASGKKATSKKEREKDRLERERLERERQEREKADREKQEKERMLAEVQAATASNESMDPTQPGINDELGVPVIYLDVNEVPANRQVQDVTDLPSVEDVLDGLGLGPKGPPIPPPAVFSVVPFPVKRKQPKVDPSDHYEFVSAGPDDPNAFVDEQSSKDATDGLPEQESSPVEPLAPKEAPTPQTPGRRGKKERSETARTGRKGSPSTKRSRRGSNEGQKSPPPTATPGSETDRMSSGGDIQDFKPIKLSHFRWVIPALGEAVIRIRFTSDDLGQFDQTLDFELTGTRRRYQLYCRGVCAFPTISREPRVVFPHRRKAKLRQDDIVFKKYLLHEEQFEFGPLLCGKTRERYKEGKYPENMEKLTILNTSPLEGTVSFCYQHDSNATTFLLDPPNMTLEPNESKVLTVWAYPKTAGRFTDTVVCCVRENPEPICFDVACYGVRPEIELDKKQLHFDKVLLHRKDTRTLYLRNSTLLPVAWRMAGMENMGEDFSLNQDAGVVEPHCEFALQLHFRASKAINIKKTIRLEVYDVDNIMGLVQTENVQVTSEAYDVALDMSFPKGADGGLDFGTIRVMDESKQTCSLKNKGKYEIGFNFVFESVAPGCPPVDTLFSVLPGKGTLIPNDRPTQVQVIFRSQAEVMIRDLPLLKCQVIEPNLGDGKEVIASIPIKLTVRSLFTKYAIFPGSDINFGPMMMNSKKTRTFAVENKGEFDFKYTLQKMIREAPNVRPRPMVHGGKRTKSRDGSSSSRSVARGGGRAQSFRQDVAGNQARLVVGCFTVYPGFGTILPGGSQTINVDCIAEGTGRAEEFLSLDVSDRNPADNPSGIPYRLLAEGCVPTINTVDMPLVFEEHRICTNLNTYSAQMRQLIEGNGVFGEEDNKFLFRNVIVGSKTHARFKISNTNKVSVDVAVSVKPMSNKVSARIHDIFEVEPSKVQIAPHDFVYATVTFQPPAMNLYACNFEATVEGLPSSATRGRSLQFEINGEGSLPRVIVTQPRVRNKQQEPLVCFPRQLLGRKQTLRVALANEGAFPCEVNLILEEEAEDGEDFSQFHDDKVFSLVPAADTALAYPMLMPGAAGEAPPYTASATVEAESEAMFDVTFLPTSERVFNGQIRVAIVDNQFEEHRIQLYGEGFKDEVTLDNLTDPDGGAWLGVEGGVVDTEQLSSELTSTEANTRSEVLELGDCAVGVARDHTFTLSNHGKDSMRFTWVGDPEQRLSFRPTVGHLHAGCSKDVTVTYKCDQPEQMVKKVVKCDISKIQFPDGDGVGDWDDRMQSVRWVDVPAADRHVRPSTASKEAILRPAKRKVIETEPEPIHCLTEQSARCINLLVSATTDYAGFTCATNQVNFKDTLMLQARVFEFEMVNDGKVVFDYNWQVAMESTSLNGSVSSRPSTATPSTRSVCVESSLHQTIAFCDEDGRPFSVAPSSGKLKPKSKQTFVVRFCPFEVNEYQARLICSIPNVNPELSEPAIKLRGRSLMPNCHFELDPCDYISGSRRNPDMPGPGSAPPGTTLDPNTRCIEFHSIGVGVRNQKKFWMMNPTASSYTFQWVCEDVYDARVIPTFVCDRTEGQLVAGKKLEMTFEFVPRALDTHESFWKFVIVEQNISIPFLLVGHSHEPDVSISLSHLNFKSLLLGRTVSETVYLVNNEPIGFNYSVREESRHSDAYSSSVDISPMEGFIPAKSKFPIQMSYHARTAGDVNFNVVVEVTRKTKPLQVNVKAQGFAMSAQLLCENSLGGKVELSAQGLNAINLGEVELNEKCCRQLHVVNTGKHNFNFEWKVQQGSRRQGADSETLTISPDEGVVAAGSRKRCTLTFQPTRAGQLPTHHLVMKVTDGPSFLCHVNGCGVNPGLDLSFNRVDFGPCFVYKAAMALNQETLTLTNKDTKDLSVECLYENSSHLEVNFSPVVIAPGTSADAVFSFYPRDTITYRETVTFQINGLSTQDVLVKGEGTELKVEVASPKQKLIKFGPLRVGQKVKHIVPIVNRSPTAITLNLSVTPVSQPLQEPGVLRLLPTETITLPGKGGSRDVEVYFAPKTRIAPFTEEIMMECAGMSQPLFIVSGSCQGIEVELDQDSIPFGAVVQNSESERRFTMQNVGDIGAGFRWDAASFKPDFSISPVQGYISPGMEVAFSVSFHPREICPDVRYEHLQCRIEGAKSLKLTLTGMCIGAPPLKEMLSFTCHVRSRDSRSVMLSNRSNQRWTLTPVIDGEFWTGPDTFVVEALQSKAYELTYRPLTMTIDGKKHQGSVFFPLPDGTGLLYNLQGQADPPKPVASVSRDVPCKTAYVELLSVVNWLRKPQRFRASVEMIKPDKLDAGTTLKGLDYIDVPGSMKRDYKLHFFAHKEGTFGAKIVFKNEKTGEYVFYYVTLRATSSGVIDVIELETPVRRSAIHTVCVDNPLAYPATFQTECKVPDINLPPQFTVPPCSEGTCVFEYQPLKVGEVSGKLVLNSADLGSYVYDLTLRAVRAAPEKTSHFKTTLGGNHVVTIKFQNYARQKTDYACKVDNPAWACDRSIAAAPASSGSGTEVTLDVTFEPMQLGESRGVLSLVSQVGGEYHFPLLGACTPPKPQGPFAVRYKTNVSIPFRNVFPSTTVFSLRVDNPMFTVKSSETIRSKKTANISVAFEGQAPASSMVAGKLTMTCVRSASSATDQPISWVFYLKGVTPDQPLI